MKSPIKNILLRKHKNYTECNKSIILNFTKTTKELLKNSNIFVKGLAISVAKKIIKDNISNVNEIYINIYDQQAWGDQVVEKINVINFKLRKDNIDLYNKIHELEQYWYNWGIYEKDYKKYGDTFEHYIPINKQYIDFQDILKDMNKEFDKIYQNNLD